MSAIDSTGTPSTGQTWLGTYEVLGQLADAGSNKAWKARVVGSQKLVQICLQRAVDAGRAKAWEVLTKLALSAPILRPHDRCEVEGHFYEIYDLPSLPTLAEWRQTHGILAESELTRCVKAMSQGLTDLHRAGLVHLSLRPDTLLVEEEDGKLRILLAGLELTTLRDQQKLIQIPVDPLYAPPEAAGLFRHTPSDKLIAWDSFSLGRIIQYLFLGRHVLSLVLNRDISTLTPELKDRAEMLASEKLDGHLRAGALEDMKEMPPRTEVLLRGLLAGSCDARWRDEELAMWLEGASPREHYHLPTKERCYRHAGQSCTIPEAAEQLRSAEHWDEATESIFEPEKPGTLAHFMKDEASAGLKQKLEVLHNMSTDKWMLQFPPQALRDVLTALSLQQISGGKLIWRGRRIDASVLLEMLEREDGSGQWLARARILCSPAVLGMLDTSDAEASRVLGEIGRHAKKAEDKARAQRWLESADILGSANLWRLSCQLNKIPALITGLRAQYACSTKPPVQALYTVEKPGIDEQLILCHLATRPPTYGFLTHEEYAAQRYGALYEEGIKIAEMLFWKRLRRALNNGPWWFGRVWWIVGGWGVFALLFAFVKPGPGWLAVGFIPALLALGMRGMLIANLQPLLSVYFPKAPAWRFMDGPARCNAAQNELRSIAELSAILSNINSDIKGLTALKPAPASVMVPPRFMGLQITALCSWLVLFSLLGYVGWQASLHQHETGSAAWRYAVALARSGRLTCSRIGRWISAAAMASARAA